MSPVVQDPLKIDEWLQQGVTVASIMQRSSWGRAQVTARATRLRMLVNPDTDKAYSLTDDEIEEARDLMRRPARSTPAPTPIVKALDDPTALLAQAAASRLPGIRKRGEFIEKRIGELREAIAAVAEQERLAVEIEKAAAKLAALRKEARKMRTDHHASGWSTKRDAATRERRELFCAERGITSTQVWEWALSQGIKCRDVAAIGESVLTAYAEAHEPVEVSA